MAKEFLLSTAARNAACDAIVDLLDATGTGTESGLVIATASSASDLCVIGLGATAFGGAATGVATATTLPATGTASTGGTAARFRLRDKAADATVMQGNVGTTGTSFTMSLTNLTIAASDQIQLTAMTVTVPAGTLT